MNIRQTLLFHTLLYLLLASGMLQAQSSTSTVAPCGAVASLEAIAYMDSLRPAIAAYQLQAKPKAIQYVPIKVHIIRFNDGTGNISRAAWDSALVNLNTLFQAADIQFYTCGEPHLINADEYYDLDVSEEDELQARYGVDSVINLYIPGGDLTTTSGLVRGYTYFPWEGKNFIAVDAASIYGSNVLAHEIGHYLGLYHTHGKYDCVGVNDELVDGSNCSYAGDDICDTPADLNLRGWYCSSMLVDEGCGYTGFMRDANGDYYQPDTRNIMSYSRLGCRDVFSCEQLERMNFFLDTERGYLVCQAVACEAPQNFYSSSAAYSHFQYRVDSVSNAVAYQSRVRIIGEDWQERSWQEGPVFIWDNLQPCTLYEVQSRTDCGASVFSEYSESRLSFTMGCEDDYCYAYGSSLTHWIAGVAIADLNNVSANEYGYADFRAWTANLVAGEAYEATLSPATTVEVTTVHWKLWMDLNHDGDFFDPGEEVLSVMGPSDAPLSSQLNIPADAIPGSTRLRVSMSVEDSRGPCTVNGEGDVEDYIVNLVGPNRVFSAQPDELIFPYDGQIQSLQLSANGPWQIQTEAPWIEIEPENGEGDAEISISCPAYADMTDRTATLTILGGSESELTISVTQLAELVNCEDVNTDIDFHLCQGDSYWFGNQVLTTAGIYTEAFPLEGGCDSIVTLTLSINEELPILEVVADTFLCNELATLYVHGANTTFLWDNGFVGEVLMVSNPGTYCVTTTGDNGCSRDTCLVVRADEEPPQLDCPADQVVTLPDTTSTHIFTWATPFASDNCATEELTSSHMSGDAFSLGTTTVNYTATDWAGNVADCAFTLTLNNTMPNEILTFYADTVNYTQHGDTLCVPIQVRNFNQVNGFQFGLSIPAELDARMLGVTGEGAFSNAGNGLEGLAVARLTDHLLGLIWLEGSGSGLSLDDDTPIFTVKLIVNESPGTCFPLAFNGEVVVIEAFQEPTGTLTPITIGGEVCQGNMITLSGRTYKTDGTPIARTEVFVSGNTTAAMLTDANGNYVLADLLGRQSYALRPQRDFDHAEGVSVLDLITLLRHVRNLELITDPYLLIAADVNQSESITISDFVEVRDIILRNITRYTQNTSWRFVPADYVFPNPNTPWAPAYPQEIDLHRVNEDTISDFHGIKIGDLNLSANAQLGMGEEFALSVENKTFGPGDTVELVLKVVQDGRWLGWQQGLRFDPAILELIDVYTPDSTQLQVHTGRQSLSAGQLRLLATVAEGRGATLIGGSELLYMRFSARSAGDLQTAIVLDSELLAPLCVDGNGQEGRLSLEWSTVTSVGDFQTHETLRCLGVYPNPFSSQLEIHFRSSEVATVRIGLQDVSGRYWGSYTTSLAVGDQAIRLPTELSATLPAGIYLGYWQTAGAQGVVKVVKQ